MDAAKFTDTKTGELVAIGAMDAPGGKDWAFIPDPLPPKWAFATRLFPLLLEAEGKLRELNGIGRTLPNPSLLLYPLQRREALRSSSLEGTYATPVELLLYELDPKEPKSESDEINAHREVSNYNKALAHGYRRMAVDNFPLSLRLVKELHEELLTGVRGRDKRPGEFRNAQVHIGSDRRYVPPPANRLDQCLNDFEKYLHRENKEFPALVQSYLVHYQFEAIHPFHDGNGRVGRALLSLTTQQWSELTLPWLYMSAYFERYKEEYIDNLFRVSTHGDWERWIEFCLRGTASQCRDAIRRCDLLNKLKNKFHAEADASSHRAHKIIECMFEYPVFKTTDIMRWCGVSRPTAQSDIDGLVKTGIIKFLDGRKPRHYYAPMIFTVAYSDEDELVKLCEEIPPPPEVETGLRIE